MAGRISSALVLFALLGLTVQSEEAAQVKPFVSVEAGGPTAQVTGMAFSPDGLRLYIAGYDKVVHVYERNSKGQYELDAPSALRVPIGPGQIGSLFDLALSVGLASLGNSPTAGA